MTGVVVGMGMINTDVLPIGSVDALQTNIDPSMVESISSETIWLNKSEKDCDCGMKSNASSRTSSTDPLEEVGDGEEGGNPASEELLTGSNAGTITRRHSDSDIKKQFGFSTITIREYARSLGDNVTVMGPPIGLSWQHQDEIVYDLIEYDQACRETRRTQSELKMPSKHRDQILRDSGYSRQEIQDAIKRANITRSQRRRTVETLNLQPLHEAFEKVGRAAKKTLKKKKEDPSLKYEARKSV